MRTTKHRRLCEALTTAIAVALLTGCGSKGDTPSKAQKSEASSTDEKKDKSPAKETSRPDSVSLAEARAIAKEAAVYGFPVIDSYRINYDYFFNPGTPEFKGPTNTIINVPRVYTPADTAIQTPNSDTPYSFLGADLRAEPLVLSVPEIEENRYYSLQFINAYTFNFAYAGSRTTGNGAGHIMLAGPKWKGEKPLDVKEVIRCETELAMVAYRTQLFDPADIDNVKEIQSEYKVQPLSRFLGQPAPPAAPKIDYMQPCTPKEERNSLKQFEVLNFVLQFCPTVPSESELMERFAKIGIGAGKELESNWLPAPKGPFAMYMRLYWPAEAALDGAWTAPKLAMVSEGTDAPSLEETQAIAEEGFIYGLPIVMNYAVMYDYVVDKDSGQYKAPFNEIKNEAHVFTYKDTAIVTPNSDTPYSFLWMDLRAEPMVLSVPAVEKGRYYAVQLEDGNTFNYGYIGSRATGNEAGNYLVVGPDWKGETPDGIKEVFRSSTQFTIAGYRTQLFNADDMPNVIKIQAGYKGQPLSAFLGQPAPPAAPAIEFPKIDKELVKSGFFEYLDFALQFAPAGPEEKEIRAKLSRIGVGPGKKFDFKTLSPEHKQAIAQGMKKGAAEIDEYLATGLKEVNGWKISSYFGNREFFKGNWLLRASGAKAGIYGNDAIEATYPLTRNDADGDPLDGSQHSYTLTFAAGEYPPVNAFWSVTMYDGKTQLLIENPINRYLINSPMLPDLKKNDDGSLTIYIQRESPGEDKKSNWLPAPDGPIYLAMRLYWPKENPPSVLPPGEGTWKPPGIMKAD